MEHFSNGTPSTLISDYLRVAVIGVGGIGSSHVRNLREMDGAELVAISDLDDEKASGIQDKFDIPNRYTDYEEMMDNEDLEAVFICTPPFVHLEPIRAAAERGLPVFVEKPLDSKIERAKEIVDICQKTGIINQMGYHWRFDDGKVEARDLLLQKGGPIALVQGRWWGGIYHVPWWIQRDKSGGQITEQTTHIFDQARWLGGDVESLQALLATEINTDIEGYDIEDVSAVLMRFKSGALGVVTSTNASVSFRAGLEVVSRDMHYIDDSSKVIIEWKDHKAEFEGKNNPYVAEERAFLSAVEIGQPTAVDVNEGLRSVELSLGAIRASQEGCRIDLPL